MRKIAGNDKFITAYEKDGKFYGIEFVNHPSPSGSPRYMPTLSDKQGYDTEDEAIEKFKKFIDELDKNEKNPPSL